MSTPSFEIPVGHVDDAESIERLACAYSDLHDGRVSITVGNWEGDTTWRPAAGQTRYLFVVRSRKSRLSLDKGTAVRGGIGDIYECHPDSHPRLHQNHAEELWPGDAIVLEDHAPPAHVTGDGVYFEVATEPSGYPAPRLSLLRNLTDRAGGCAPYEGAFRRETLPPDPVPANAESQIGTNRVNEHTLDMRYDRQPLPTKHHHGTVTGPGSVTLSHTETAVVLSRHTYGLPPVGNSEEGHAVLYRDPLEKGTQDAFRVPVRPGSIVVTPSTPDRLYGHCFENAFAMLVAIPGFVVPYEMINPSTTTG